MEGVAFVVVAFGDKIAAVLIQINIRLMVEMYESIEPVASQKMMNDMFVDDLVMGGEMPEVHGEQGRGTMAKVMTKRGIYFNGMQRSGERDDEQMELIGADRMGIS